MRTLLRLALVFPLSLMSVRDGKLVKRFDSGAEPESAEVTKTIEAALAAK